MIYLRHFLPLFLTLILLFGCATTSKKSSPDTAPPADSAEAEDPVDWVPDLQKNSIETQDSSNGIEDSFADYSGSYENNLTSAASLTSDDKNDLKDKSSSDTITQPALDKALEYCEASQDFWQKGEFENAIIALDQAYSLIIEVETNDTPKLIQQKEDLRFMISKRILEIYASRNIVVNGDHNAIPMTINKHVQKEIDRYTKGRDRIFFIESYKRSGRYRPKMVAALQEAGLPTNLSWLPLIESGFKIRALSRARALGLWQFIPSTGYKFGLKRNMYIDERLDPEKATQAAVSYLKELHQIFGDWTTVLAAYNCGEGRVLRTIRSQNVNYLDNFWDLYEKLPWETASYVPKFLATLHIVDNLEKYGLSPMALDSPVPHETVEISKQIHLKDVAGQLGMPLKVIADMNPELRHKLLPPDPYLLKITPDKKEALLAALDNIPVASPPTSLFVYHRVRRGQSLSTIAKKYGTTTWRIARANNIRKKNYIVAGKLLKIPLKGAHVPKTRKYEKASSHVVKRGDSLWLIANRYGTTTKKIQSTNNLSTTKLHVGQILKIPGYEGNTAAVKGLKKYVVKSGDSPAKIAQKHNMSLNQLLTLNHLSTRSKIFPGQMLIVK